MDMINRLLKNCPVKTKNFLIVYYKNILNAIQEKDLKQFKKNVILSYDYIIKIEKLIQPYFIKSQNTIHKNMKLFINKECDVKRKRKIKGKEETHLEQPPKKKRKIEKEVKEVKGEKIKEVKEVKGKKIKEVKRVKREKIKEDECYINMLPKEYKKMIGRGSFGDIYESEKNPLKAVKAIKRERKCYNAKNEHIIHTNIYDVFKLYETKDIKIPKPGKFCVLGDKKYKCMYEMEKLITPRNDKWQMHLIFDQKYIKQFDKKLKKPIGYFLGIDEAKKMKYDVEKIIQSMGKLLSLFIIAANYSPMDVEYVYVRDENRFKVAAVDFGEFRYLSFKEEGYAVDQIMNSYNYYYPSREEDPYHVLVLLQSFVKMTIDNNFFGGKTERKEKIVKYFYRSILNQIQYYIIEKQYKLDVGKSKELPIGFGIDIVLIKQAKKQNNVLLDDLLNVDISIENITLINLVKFIKIALKKTLDESIKIIKKSIQMYIK
jgi:hypothetical protein